VTLASLPIAGALSIRAILQDANSFPEPERFKPERFLTLDGRVAENPLLDYAFGFGARCVFTSYLFSSLLSYYAIGKAMPWPSSRRHYAVDFHRVHNCGV
jgi:hypothetical protein